MVRYTQKGDIVKSGFKITQVPKTGALSAELWACTFYINIAQESAYSRLGIIDINSQNGY